jgi:hypothetical protein
VFLIICNQKLNGVLQGYSHVACLSVFILPYWCVLLISSVYTHVYITAGHLLKSPCICLRTGHSLITAEQIFMKSDFGEFYEKCLCSLYFPLNPAIILTTLYELQCASVYVLSVTN